MHPQVHPSIKLMWKSTAFQKSSRPNYKQETIEVLLIEKILIHFKWKTEKSSIQNQSHPILGWYSSLIRVSNSSVQGASEFLCKLKISQCDDSTLGCSYWIILLRMLQSDHTLKETQEEKKLKTRHSSKFGSSDNYQHSSRECS